MSSGILAILNLLESDSKRTHKINVLTEQKGNTLLKDVIFQALSPTIQFHVRKIPEYTHVTNNVITLSDALIELKQLSTRQLTGNRGIAHFQNLLTRLSPDDAVVLERIIKKDLRCGTAEGIVNAVYTDFIPELQMLLARPFSQKNIANINFPALSQLKADGKRSNVILTGDDIVICGRSGKHMDFLGHLDAHVLGLRKTYGKDCVLDGELVVVDANGKVLPRKIGNGIINKAVSGTISDEEAKQVRFQLWDIIPYDEWSVRKSKDIYRVRLQALKDLLAANNVEPNKSWLIEGREVKDFEDAQLHFEEMLNRGEEGTIIKNYDSLWEDTRSKHLVKMKAERECDLEVIGFTPGTGKFKGLVGSLQCASSDRKVEANISGFSDELRAWVTENIDPLLNSIVMVVYNERISSKSKGREEVDSLFLPRFGEWRNDKLTADSTHEIK